MGIKHKTDRLEGKQLDQVIGLSRFLASFLHASANAFDILTATLMELKSARTAIKRGAAPLPHSELKRLMDATDERLGAIIGRCEIVKYELGRLHLKADSGLDFSQLSIYKDLLRHSLKEAHGVDFLVKLHS